MPITRWFHERKRDESGPHPLIFDIPSSVRVKVRMVLERVVSAVGRYDDLSWPTVIGTLAEAFGVSTVQPRRTHVDWTTTARDVWQLFLDEAPYNEFLTAVEVTLQLVEAVLSRSWNRGSLDAVVGEINELLGAEHCGFRFVDSNETPRWRAVRIDSEITFDTTVQRPLGALAAAGFVVAEQQFVQALRKRTEGDWAGAITDANAAFESVMKKILGVEKGEGSDLLQQMAKAGYLPGATSKALGPLGDVFELVAIIRNQKSSAHGRLNRIEQELPRYADLALGLAGTFINFFVDEYLDRSKSATRDNNVGEVETEVLEGAKAQD